MNLLEQLKLASPVVADTGDIDAIVKYGPQDATTNPSLILKAVLSGQYDTQINQVLSSVKNNSSFTGDVAEQACDRLIVAMGCLILDSIPGRVSTEVYARLSFDTAASVAKARHLAALYHDAGISNDRFLIKLAATWEGICAARVLEAEGIQCNLTLIFNTVQARACAEASVFLISPFVGRILDWYRNQHPETHFEPEEEPGVLLVREIYQYFRERGYPTVVMGASFRNTGEILALAGCDRLTISPALLNELSVSEGVVTSKIGSVKHTKTTPVPLLESEFREQMSQDAMATEKLAEGIRGFESDQDKLEQLIRKRLG